jgi:hypothetical protein
VSKKVTKKRQPETKQPVSGTGFQLSFCGTVVKVSGALMSLTDRREFGCSYSKLFTSALCLLPSAFGFGVHPTSEKKR